MKTYSIGRDLGCDIVINDTTDVVSRRHAVLTVASSGKMTLTDLSSNGTYINGIKMTPNVAVPVSRKDSISFAHVATLDWNMIPKPKGWLTWLIIGLCAVAVATIAAMLFTQHGQPSAPDNGVVTDTLAMPADSTAIMDSIAADTLANPKADTVKPQPKKKDKAKKQEQPESQPEEQPADTVKPAQPRPIGV